jgi:hypothetical protein
MKEKKMDEKKLAKVAKQDAAMNEWVKWRKLVAENPSPAMKNWRAWGSWFSWGSPVGLAIFINVTLLSVGVFIQLIR